jgi:hypothetical protein
MLRIAFIKERHGEELAINVDNVSSIRVTHGVVYVHLCGDKAVATDFKNIQEAWAALII